MRIRWRGVAPVLHAACYVWRFASVIIETVFTLDNLFYNGYPTVEVLFSVHHMIKPNTSGWASPNFTDTSLSTLQIFELYRAEVADGRMSAFWVVKPFNVIEDIDAQFVAGTIPPPAKALCFQGGEETLHCGIIPAIATAAHTASDAMRFQ